MNWLPMLPGTALILAGNSSEYYNFMHRYDFKLFGVDLWYDSKVRVSYISSPACIRGYRDVDVVKVGTWYKNYMVNDTYSLEELGPDIRVLTEEEWFHENRMYFQARKFVSEGNVDALLLILETMTNKYAIKVIQEWLEEEVKLARGVV